MDVAARKITWIDLHLIFPKCRTSSAFEAKTTPHSSHTAPSTLRWRDDRDAALSENSLRICSGFNPNFMHLIWCRYKTSCLSNPCPGKLGGRWANSFLRPTGWLTNVRLRWIYSPRTNDLAYFAQSSVVKSLVWPDDVNFIQKCTSYDSSLGPSFIISNSTKSDLMLDHSLLNVFPFQSIAWYSAPNKISVLISFSFKVR